jgi:ribosomal protein S18 acetylase RimI-like enzyme
MTDDLVALSDRGYHVFSREITMRQGGIVIEQDGMFHAAGLHDAPFISNETMRLDRTVPAAVAVARAREYAARFGRVAGMSTFGDDGDLDDELAAAGWDKAVVLDGMVLTEPVEESAPEPGTALRTVTTPADLAVMVSVLGESFGPDEPWPSLWASVFTDLSTIDQPDTSAVIAELDGEPAAAAVGYALDPVGVVGMVGTIARFGRRGLGNLVTRHVAAFCQRQTGRPVVLQASPEGAGLYERIGFRPVTRYGIWIDRPPRPAGGG